MTVAEAGCPEVEGFARDARDRVANPLHAARLRLELCLDQAAAATRDDIEGALSSLDAVHRAFEDVLADLRDQLTRER